MRVSIRSGLLGLLGASVFVPVPLTEAQAQAPAVNGRPAPAPSAARAAAPAVPTHLDQVLATVNGAAITRGELVNFLNCYPPPPLDHEEVYHDALQSLVNTRLIGQFLARQRIPVPPGKVEEAIAQLERDVKSDGRDLQTALRESRLTMDDLRREYVDRIRWVAYVNQRANDAELRKFAAAHKDLISGTQVRASHIYIMVPDNASAAEKEKTRRKLLAIKQEILDRKISFADAANKFSEDPGNAERKGGDIGYFEIGDGVVDEFARAAFALRPGQLSDPVETMHGLHLILVTDRKEGSPVDFEKQKTHVLQVYAAQLQKEVLIAERRNAEEKRAIAIKPMPPDLFPATPAAASGNAVTPASGSSSGPIAPGAAAGTPK